MNSGRKPYIFVTLDGPDDGGDFGRNTPGTKTSGIQEALNYTHETTETSTSGEAEEVSTGGPTPRRTCTPSMKLWRCRGARTSGLTVETTF